MTSLGSSLELAMLFFERIRRRFDEIVRLLSLNESLSRIVVVNALHFDIDGAWGDDALALVGTVGSHVQLEKV